MVTPIEVSPNMAILPAGDDAVLYVYLTGRCRTANIATWRAHTEAIMATSKGRIHPLVFLDAPFTLGSRGRAAMTAFVDAMHGHVSALVIVLNATIFWRSLVRTAVSTGLIHTKRDYPVTIVADLPEASTAFAKVGVALNLEAAAAALTTLRQAVATARHEAAARGDHTFVVPTGSMPKS